MKAMGVRSGVPDLCLMWKGMLGPQTAFIELKVGANQLTDEQAMLIERVEDLGFRAGVARTMDQFIGLLKAFGVPMRKCRYGVHEL